MPTYETKIMNYKRVDPFGHAGGIKDRLQDMKIENEDIGYKSRHKATCNMHLEKESLEDASMDCDVNGASSNDRSCTHLKLKVEKYFLYKNLRFLESVLCTLTLYGVDERD